MGGRKKAKKVRADAVDSKKIARAPGTKVDDSTTPEHAGLAGCDVGDMPRDRDGLHAWLKAVLSIEVPRAALIAGHASPFDYLCHAFFEDGSACVREKSTEPVVRRPARDCVVWANRGGGKTFLGAVATLLDMVFKPGIEVRILGGSLEQSRRMHEHLRNLFEHDERLSRLVAGRITENRVRLHNGSRCEILAQSQTSVRGTRVQKLRCDEVELFDADVWEAAQLVTRSKHVTLADGSRLLVRGSIEALSTMHRPHGLMFTIVRSAGSGRDAKRRLFKWGVIDVLERCGDEHVCEGPAGKCGLWEHCGGRAKIEEVMGAGGHVRVDDALTQQSRVDQSTWESEMLCLRPRKTGLVLTEFDPRVHVVEELPPAGEGSAWIAGMDFGVRSPTVILIARLDIDGVLYVAHEHVATDATLSEHVGAMRTPGWPAPEWIGVDPAGRARSTQTGLSDVQHLRRLGLRVRDRRLGLHAGLAMLRHRLRPAAGAITLYVHARCEKLIESLQRYRFDADHPTSETPIKDGSDHAVDALRYMVQNMDGMFQTGSWKYA
jgi:hypothetical protein